MLRGHVRHRSSIGVLRQQRVWVADESERHGRANTQLALTQALLRFIFPVAYAGTVFQGHANNERSHGWPANGTRCFIDDGRIHAVGVCGGWRHYFS